MMRSWLVRLAISSAWTVQVAGQGRDTVVIRADGPPVWGAVRLVEELNIGDVDGPPEYAFGRVGLLAVDHDGGFYLWDDRQKVIRRYDARGRHERAIGRSGAGPGEYEWVAAMAVTSDSLLLVHDPNNARLTWFGRDGRVRRSMLARSGFGGKNFIVDHAGRIYFDVPIAGERPEGTGAVRQWVRYRGDRPVDSLRQVAQGRIGDVFYLSTSDGMRWNFVDQPVQGPYHGGGFLLARASRYRVVVDTGGPTVRAIERRVTALRLGDAERQEWRAMATFMERRGDAARRYEVPATKPLIRDVTSDHLGRIWVEVYVEAERRTNIPPRPPERGPLVTWRERQAFDLFTPDGTYLARIPLPQEGLLLAARNDHLWVRTKGADGEDRVVRFRMVRGS